MIQYGHSHGENVVKKIVLSALVLFIAAAVAPAFGAKEKNERDALRLRVAHTQNYYPYDFINEKGESDGFEVAVLKEVNKLLPEYSFEFSGTSDDDLLIGVESGKYAMGVKGAWLTDERKKKFIVPEATLAASVIGLVFRTADADRIKDFESFARYSGKLVPIPPLSAQWTIMEDFNKNHPETPVKLVPSDVYIISDAYTWVVETRYDGFLDIQVSFQATVLDEGGAWHRYADRLSYVPYRAIPTYPLINKNYPDLASQYDAAMKILAANGTLAELAVRYFGEDIFQYL
jgi:L-cystine transport system substrate-binding protein